jgi:hypothetical protein
VVEAEYSPEPRLRGVLHSDEELRVQARATDSLVAVTDRRLVIAAPKRVALAIPFVELRRIQFDIEKDRPATLVVVPETPEHEPQVLTIPPEQYQAAAEALVAIGLQLAAVGQRRGKKTG